MDSSDILDRHSCSPEDRSHWLWSSPDFFFSCFQLVENLITIRWIAMKLGNDINGPKENPNCTADPLTLPSSRSASTLYIQISQQLQDWFAQIFLQRDSDDPLTFPSRPTRMCFFFFISYSMHCHEKKIVENICKLEKKKKTLIDITDIVP